jgi:hypothetical protein
MNENQTHLVCGPVGLVFVLRWQSLVSISFDELCWHPLKLEI